MWTRFSDMHSGGGTKLDYEAIFIEADENEACRLFEAKFDRSPHDVTCSCCGADYDVQTFHSLAQATGYERSCAFGPRGYVEEPSGRGRYSTLEEYIVSGKALILSMETLRVDPVLEMTPSTLLQRRQ